MNMFKRALILFVCLVTSLSAADWKEGLIREPENMKKIDGKMFYVITSAEELAWFAAQVNAGKTTINAQLANDIKFIEDASVAISSNSPNWTPIGKDSTVMFNGIFDGAGRTIYGLYCKQKIAGLFGGTNRDAVVKNIRLKGYIDTYGEFAGGIVALNWGTISNCTNSSEIYSWNSNSDITTKLGGIAGWNAGMISGCMNFVLHGELGHYIGDLELGGIVGQNEGVIRRCVNVASFNWYYFHGNYTIAIRVGGIVGRNRGIVTDCVNLGSGPGLYGLAINVDTTAEMLNSFSVMDSAAAGIIYVNPYSAKSQGAIINCYYDSDVLPDKSTVAPNSGMHTSDMQSDRFAWMLNTTNGTAEHSGVWSRDSVGYPIFADSIFKPIYKVFFDDGDATIFRYSNYKGLISFPADPEGKEFFGWYTDDGVKVEETTVFTKDLTVRAIFDSTEIPQISSSSSSAASSSSGEKSSSSAASSSSSSSAVKNSSSSSEPSDALVANLPSPTWSVTASGRNFQIHAVPVGKPYALFDLQGKVLAEGRIESPEMTLSVPRAGSYIVRIGERSVRMNAK